MDNVYQLQQLCHQHKYFTELLDIESTKQSKDVVELIKSVIKYSRSFCQFSIRYTTLSHLNVLDLIRSPIYTEDKKVQDKKQPIPTELQQEMLRFGQACFNYIPYILESASKFFHTEGFKEYCFDFAGSALMSLFGFCWNKEQSKTCVSSLIYMVMNEMKYLAKKNIDPPITTSSSFRNNFVKDLIRQFFLISGIQNYLISSLSNPLLDLFNDPQLTQDHDFMPIVTNYAKIILSLLIKNANKMPNIILYFFRELYQTVSGSFPDNPDEWKLLIKVIFYDSIIRPSITNPMLFGIFPASYILPNTHVLPFLSKAFGTALGFNVTPDSISDSDNGSEEATTLINYLIRGSSDFDKVSIRDVISGFKIDCPLQLFSTTDLILIAHIINNSPTKGGMQHFRSLCEFETRINFKEYETTDLWCDNLTIDIQNYKRKDIHLNSVFIPVDQQEIANDQLTYVAKHLIFYLQNIPLRQNNYQTIKEFLESNLKRAIEINSAMEQTTTSIIYEKVIALNIPSDVIINRAKDIMYEKMFSQKKIISNSFFNQEILDKLSDNYQSLQKLNYQQRSFIHQKLVAFYFLKNKEDWNAILNEKDKFIHDSNFWLETFQRTADKVINFSCANGLKKSEVNSLKKQLHSYILQLFPMSSFLKRQAPLLKQGEKLVAQQSIFIERFVNEGHSKSLQKLLQTGPYFESAVAKLQRITKFNAPLDIFDIISNVVETLQNIYGFDSGEAIPGDDFLPLVTFTILKAAIPEIFAISAYLNHFLGKENGAILLEREQEYIYASFISALKILLDSMIKSK
ncbi:hypothetical protein GPJ56_010963 [Histomonas meleagridis]|uniref:uncharacterized protein n=1 Tax=Histomonas meleagridis TaxID=135588 RepID=UPI003559AB30|nr:hypothetical protein GPJ56_010963 [Histomonas meleagridis]KAH0800740.1 hypothetical protein GO595_006493 [Histomonas meleagridis]